MALSLYLSLDWAMMRWLLWLYRIARAAMGDPPLPDAPPDSPPIP